MRVLLPLMLVMLLLTVSDREFYALYQRFRPWHPVCPSCRVVAYLNGRPLLTEAGYPLKFATRTDAERYAKAFDQP